MSRVQNVMDAILWAVAAIFLVLAIMLLCGCTLPDKAIDGGNAKVQKNTDKSWTVTYPAYPVQKGGTP